MKVVKTGDNNYSIKEVTMGKILSMYSALKDLKKISGLTSVEEDVFSALGNAIREWMPDSVFLKDEVSCRAQEVIDGTVHV